jgi:hypothetical protein
MCGPSNVRANGVGKTSCRVANEDCCDGKYEGAPLHALEQAQVGVDAQKADVRVNQVVVAVVRIGMLVVGLAMVGVSLVLGLAMLVIGIPVAMLVVGLPVAMLVVRLILVGPVAMLVVLLALRVVNVWLGLVRDGLDSGRDLALESALVHGRQTAERTLMVAATCTVIHRSEMTGCLE